MAAELHQEDGGWSRKVEAASTVVEVLEAAVTGVAAAARVAGRWSGGIGRGCGRRVAPEGEEEEEEEDTSCDEEEEEDDDDAHVADGTADGMREAADGIREAAAAAPDKESSAGRGEPQGEGVGGAIEGAGAP